MKIFVSGGCKNGKSSYAEDLAVKLAAPGKLYYIATMIPHDGEDLLRIERHVAARAGKGFQTVERGLDLMGEPELWDPEGTYLLDSVTALLSNEMFRADGGCSFDSADAVDEGCAPDSADVAEVGFAFDPSAGVRVAEQLADFCGRVKHAVFVSDYIYGGGRYDDMTETYLQGLAACDRRLAEVCEIVIEVNGGLTTFHKGEWKA